MPAIGDNAYPALLDLYFRTNPGASVSTPQEQQSFNDWSGSVTRQFGVNAWENLPVDFAQSYKPDPFSGGIYDNVTKITSDFFGGILGDTSSANPLAGQINPVGTASTFSNGNTDLLKSVSENNASSPGQSDVDKAHNNALAILSQFNGTVGKDNSGPADTSHNASALTPPAVSINSVTNAPTVTNFFADNADKRVVNSTSTSTFSPTYNINDTGFVANVLGQLKDFFGTKVGSASSIPFNDAAQTRGATFPGSMYSGAQINTAFSGTGTPNIPAATVTGISIPSAQTSNFLNYALLAVGIISLFVFISRRSE